MTKIILLMTLLTPGLWAQNLTDPVYQLLQLNSAPHGEMENKCRNNQVSFKKENLQQCMVDLCGTADQVDSVYLTDENFSEATDSSVLERFPHLEEDISSLGNYFQDTNEILADEIERRLNRESSGLNSINTNTELQQKYAQAIFQPLLRTSVDLSKPLEERLTVSTLPHERGEEFSKALSDFQEKYRQSVISGPWTIQAYNGVLTPAEVFEKARMRIRELKEELERSGSDGLLYDESQRMIDYVEEFIRDREGDAYLEDAQRLAGAIIGLEDNLSPSDGGGNEAIKPSCQSGPCLSYVRKELSQLNLKDSLKGFRQRNEDFNPYSAIRNCQDLIVSKSFGSESGIQNFKERLPKIIENYKNKVLKKFSQRTARELGRAIDNDLNFLFPNIEAGIQNFDGELFNRISNAERSLPYMDRIEQIDDVFLLTWYQSNLDENDLHNPFLPVEQVCEPGPYVTGSDYFVPLEAFSSDEAMFMDRSLDFEKNNINVSPFSCEHAHHGEDVVSHELSHFVSYLFTKDDGSKESKEHFKSLRSCALKTYENAKNNNHNGMTPFFHEGDKRTTEEDTADLLAFAAYRDSEDLFTCSMLAPGQEGGFDLQEKPHDMSVHSLVHFRVLNEAIQKKKALSESCRRYLDEVGDDFEEVQCIDSL